MESFLIQLGAIFFIFCVTLSFAYLIVRAVLILLEIRVKKEDKEIINYILTHNDKEIIG